MDEKLNINEKLKETLTDKDFLSEIFQTKDNEEIIKKFKSKGIDVTEGDCEKIKEGSNKMFEELDKLDDDTLKELSGGWSLFRRKSNGQKIREAFSDATTEILTDHDFVSGAVTGAINGLFGLVKSGASCLADACKSKPKPALPPVPETPPKEENSSSAMMGAASAVAVTAAAGLVYANRKKIKKMWNHYTK